MDVTLPDWPEPTVEVLDQRRILVEKALAEFVQLLAKDEAKESES